MRGEMIPQGSNLSGWGNLEKGKSKSGQIVPSTKKKKTTELTGGMTQIPATNNPKPRLYAEYKEPSLFWNKQFLYASMNPPEQVSIITRNLSFKPNIIT